MKFSFNLLLLLLIKNSLFLVVLCPLLAKKTKASLKIYKLAAGNKEDSAKY